MTRLFKTLLIAALSALPLLASAQSRVITGTVYDETGEPVIGAGIVVNEVRGLGANTDLDGRFSLKVDPSVHKTFSVMLIGYGTVTETIDERTDYRITITPETDKLDEVVVVAYGTQKKLSVTGSVSYVKNDDLRKSTTPNFQASLAGRLPGLNVTQSSGMPGNEQITMNLRGVSTYGDSSPLVLIDGVPRDDMSSLDANEVESVTILKDAAATAVFGVRGANGVILVTTQHGATGKANVSVNAEYGVQQIINRGAYKIDSWDYAALLNEKNSNLGKAPAYNEWQIEQFKSGTNPFFPNRDAWDEYTQLGQQYKVNANASGGTDRVSYFINASYQHQGSVFATQSSDALGYDPSFWLNRLNIRANLDFKITEDLKLSLNISSYLNTINQPLISDNVYWSDERNGGEADLSSSSSAFLVGGLNREAPIYVGPTIPAGATDASGNPVEEGGFIKNTAYQLYARLNYAGYLRQTKTTMNSSAALDWDMKKLVEGLKFRAMFSYDLYAQGFIKGQRQYNWYSVYQGTSENDPSYYYQVSSDNAFNGYYADPVLQYNYSYGSAGRVASSYYKFNTQAQFTYNNTFGDKHNLSAILLGQYDNYVSNDAVSLYLPYNMLYLSSRVNYNYDNRYTAEINLGVNGSEQFAADKRWGVFPAASVSWNLSEEPFFRDHVSRKVVDLVKFRASYGVVGNDKMSDSTRFLYLDDVKVVSGGAIPTLGRGNYVSTNVMGNPDLTWEKSYKQNYGLEVGFLNGFTFTADFFWEDRKDILVNRSTVPLVQGLSSSALPRVNLGRVKNHGFELVLDYHKYFENDMFLAVSGNFNFARNRVVAADEVQLTTGKGGYYSEYRQIGYPIGQIWCLEVDYSDGAGNGYINTEEDLEKYGAMYDKGGYVRSFLGQWKFVDQNGDGKIDIKDQIPAGYSSQVPEITYGFNFSWGWKGFDVSFLLQGVAHKSGFLCVGMFGDGHLTGEWETHAWTKERFENGELITYQALNDATLANTASNERNTYVLNDLSFLRLKNAEIGYTLPSRVTKKLKMQKIRFSVVGQNLFNTYCIPTRHVDPETSNENNFPLTRNVNFSVQLQF